MIDEERTGRQPIEPSAGVGARVLREILRTPAFMEIIKTNLPERKPEEARLLVKTMLWEDAGFSMSAMAAMPAVIDNLAAAILELGRQLSTFPPVLLESFVQQLSSDIDTGAYKEIAEVYGAILERQVLESDELRDRSLASLVGALNAAVRAGNRVMEHMIEGGSETAVERANIDTAALGRSITLSARLISRAIERNPYFLRDVLANVDVREVLFAAFRVTRSIVLSVVSGISRLWGQVRGLSSTGIGRQT